MTAPATLQEAWLGAPDGRLCPREQARAWALQEVWQEEGKGSYGLLPFVASKVKTNKDGKPIGKAPTKQAIGEFFSMVYSYPYSLARRAIVATADLSAKNLHMLRTNHWLKNPRNVLVLRLTGSTWEGEAPHLLLFHSAEQLVEDLRLTPFAAREVLALRTTFLDQGA